MTPIERRIARLEAGKSASAPVPVILIVGMTETPAEARARFDTAYPQRRAGHAVLCVPAKPRTDEERALWEDRFHVGQMALVADARRNRIAIVPAAEAAPQSTFSSGTPVPPKGRSLTQWKRNS